MMPESGQIPSRPMTLRLTVNRQAWLDHVRLTASQHGTTLPVVKGNGYGFGRPILFEREETPCRAWCRHKDRLALHTDKARSSLPGLPFESALPRYVPRVAFVSHLGAYA